MNLAKFPRRRYTHAATPVEFMEHLTAEIGGPRIYMKRDDLLGGAAGGNKTRKLEFVMADALLKGADTVITCGAIQSNHCRLTLSAAVKEGLKCRLVLEERVPGTFKPRGSGNNLLYHLMGVEKLRVMPGGSDMMAEMEKEAEELRQAGRTPYIIPGGASFDIGALGYVACAEEMLAQFFDMGLKVDRVVCASGSAGTHAGLLTGFLGNNSGIGVVGVSVQRKNEEQVPKVHNLAERTASLLGIKGGIPAEAVVCFDQYVGPGYSVPTPGMIDAVKLLARKEAILLDPVYTGKVMDGMLDLCRSGYFTKDETIVFVHTGGSPALYAYLDEFID